MSIVVEAIFDLMLGLSLLYLKPFIILFSLRVLIITYIRYLRLFLELHFLIIMQDCSAYLRLLTMPCMSYS